MKIGLKIKTTMPITVYADNSNVHVKCPKCDKVYKPLKDIKRVQIHNRYCTGFTDANMKNSDLYTLDFKKAKDAFRRGDTLFVHNN